MKHVWRALRHRNYRLTGSVMLLGTVGFINQIPAFLLAPLAGVLADRGNRLRKLVVIQSLAMVQACILAFLVLTGAVQVWHILLLGGFLGFLMGASGIGALAGSTYLASRKSVLGLDRIIAMAAAVVRFRPGSFFHIAAPVAFSAARGSRRLRRYGPNGGMQHRVTENCGGPTSGEES